MVYVWYVFIRRYQEREREAAEQEPGTSNADEMEVEKAHKRNLTAQKSAEPMECKWTYALR